MKKTWTERPSHIYVADVDLGLVGCAPLKAGSSTWKAWWWFHLTPDMNHEGKSVPGHQSTIAKIPVTNGEELLTAPNKVLLKTVQIKNYSALSKHVQSFTLMKIHMMTNFFVWYLDSTIITIAKRERLVH